MIGVNTGLWYDVGNFKQEVLKNVHVEAASISAYSPIETNWSESLTWDGKNAETDEECNLIWCDWDYAKVFRLQMAQGDFLQEALYGEARSVVLNEAAAKIVGAQEIIGTKVNGGKVVGIVKDFNFRSFHDKITPLIMYHWHESEGKVFFRISPHNQKETLNYIREVFQQFRKDIPFEYFSMEDEYMALYQKEIRLGRLFIYFSLLSIFISCMGVFSLVALLIKQRSKEIAIRKINGANATDIVMLFAREFSLLTVVAFVIASSFAWFAMSRWLQSYAYRTGIGWWIFAGELSLILTLVISSLVVQVYRAARRNPVESLKYE